MDYGYRANLISSGETAAQVSRYDVKRILVFVGAAALMGVFWDSVFLKPLRLFVVYLHEASHGIVLLATGGKIESIQVFMNEGGVAVGRGGSRFWTLTAGYLGSLLWGCLILLVSSRTRHSRLLAMSLGIGAAALTVFYVRNTVGFLVGMTAAAFFIIGALLFTKGAVLQWSMRIIGLASCLYAVYDIASDVLYRPELRSDARMLAEHTGFPPILSTTHKTLFWGAAWILISIAVTALTVRAASKRPKQESGGADNFNEA